MGIEEMERTKAEELTQAPQHITHRPRIQAHSAHHPQTQNSTPGNLASTLLFQNMLRK